jgi:hypothetical protein
MGIVNRHHQRIRDKLSGHSGAHHQPTTGRETRSTTAAT